MRTFALFLCLLMLSAASPLRAETPAGIAAPQVVSHAVGPICAQGRKSEHFPNVDLWDVIRLIGADFQVNLQPSLLLPHTAIDADLTCFSRQQAVSFVQGLGLRIIPVGDGNDRVYMVYASADGDRMQSDVQAFQLRHTTADAELEAKLRAALSPSAFVAVHADNNMIVVSGSPEDVRRAAALIAAFDQKTQNMVATIKIDSGQSADDIVKKAAVDLPPNTLVADSATNSVIATGSPTVIAQAQQLVQAMDAPGWAVALHLQIVDYFPHNDSDNTGIALGGVDSSGNVTPGSGSSIVTIPGFKLQGNAAIYLNTTKGLIDVDDLGTLTINNNQSATLNDATDYPFTIQNTLQNTYEQIDKLIGLVAKESVVISADGKLVTITSDVTDSDFNGYTPQGQPISIQIQGTGVNTTTDRHPVVVDNLFEHMRNEQIQSVPGLSRIPLIGALFRYRQAQRREGHFMLMITPCVVQIGEPTPVECSASSATAAETVPAAPAKATAPAAVPAAVNHK